MKRAGQMWVRDDDHYMPQFFDASGDRFKIERLESALAFCRSRRTAVDVGAHYGSWSRHLARTFQDVWAFEPVQETFDCLLLNTVSFPNIRALRRAVGDANRRVSVGIGKMYHHPGMETVIAREGKIDLVAIDDLDLRDVDLLKIDVEGFELHVLEGARNIIIRDRPIIIFEENIRGMLEHNVPAGTCHRYLEDLGAKLLSVHDADFIFGWS